MAKKKGKACSCDLASMLGGIALLAIGVYLTVQGLVLQFDGATWWPVTGWYAVGILVLVVGKMLKHSGCSECKLHNM